MNYISKFNAASIGTFVEENKLHWSGGATCSVRSFTSVHVIKKILVPLSLLGGIHGFFTVSAACCMLHRDCKGWETDPSVWDCDPLFSGKSGCKADLRLIRMVPSCSAARESVQDWILPNHLKTKVSKSILNDINISEHGAIGKKELQVHDLQNLCSTILDVITRCKLSATGKYGSWMMKVWKRQGHCDLCKV